MNLDRAQWLAEEVAALFEGVCVEIAVVGSVRRRKAEGIKDVELLCRPRMYSPQDTLFGGDDSGQMSCVKRRADELHAQGVIRPRLNDLGNPECWGEKNMRFAFCGESIDLFSVFPGQSWGVKMAIYTGPASFSQKLVTTRDKGGFLQIGQQILHGNLVDRGVKLTIPHEFALFEALEIKYIEPEYRQ